MIHNIYPLVNILTTEDDSLYKDSLVFVSRDSAPSKSFRLLAENFPGATLLLGDGVNIDATDAKIKQKAHSARALIVGMSHSKEAADLEILAVGSAGVQTRVA